MCGSFDARTDALFREGLGQNQIGVGNENRPTIKPLNVAFSCSDSNSARHPYVVYDHCGLGNVVLRAIYSAYIGNGSYRLCAVFVIR